jgi:hypothetical protein
MAVLLKNRCPTNRLQHAGREAPRVDEHQSRSAQSCKADIRAQRRAGGGEGCGAAHTDVLPTAISVSASMLPRAMLLSAAATTNVTNTLAMRQNVIFTTNTSLSVPRPSLEAIRQYRPYSDVHK